ncbi:hypothetical protein F518_04193 [Serratia marcescens VGH107]|nr:hypothetical protein F518_04193 [Serratia marcescens VGH107]
MAKFKFFYNLTVEKIELSVFDVAVDKCGAHHSVDLPPPPRIRLFKKIKHPVKRGFAGDEDTLISQPRDYL